MTLYGNFPEDPPQVVADKLDDNDHYYDPPNGNPSDGNPMNLHMTTKEITTPMTP
jgi:hypothetical protein